MASAVERVADQVPPPVERVGQTVLFPAEALDELGGDRVERMEQLRGRGRPKGSANKRTEEWADFLLQRYPSPLQGLAEIASRRTLDLALELGCKPKEALEIQLRAMAELAPYLHGKKPVEVSITGALPVFVFGDPKAYAAHQAAGAGLSLADFEIVEDQGVIEGNATRVEQPELNSSDNVQQDQGTSADAAMIADHGQDQGQEGER